MIAQPVALEPDRRPVLDLMRIGHRFGRLRAVDDVTLSVGEGEIVCLVGPSGCGKSTLLRIAAGLEQVQEGRVRIAGDIVAQPGRDHPPERRGVGLVFQDYALFPHLSVIDNVRFGLSGLDGPAQRRQALAALERVGMADYALAYPHTLSGGQQQRVALARAMAPRPRVLLLDEPFSGLDARLRIQVREQTLDVLKRSGVATLIVTHDPEEAMFLADRIAVMHDGRLAQTGSPVDLYCRPVDGFVAGFFGDVNRLSGVVRDGRVDTAVGAVPASRLADGTGVEVLIRPEALRLTETGPDTPHARVMAARLLGRSSLIQLRLANGGAGEVDIRARMPGLFIPAVDSFVSIDLDRRQSFVFPTTGAI